MTDVPHLVRAIDANSSIFKARASASKRATKGYKTPVASPPPHETAGAVAPTCKLAIRWS